MSLDTQFLLTEIHALKLEVKNLTAAMLHSPEWFSLRKACEFKGIPYGSVKGRPHKQPRFGFPDKLCGTRKYWSRKTIVEWAQVLDSADFERYRRAHNLEYKMI